MQLDKTIYKKLIKKNIRYTVVNILIIVGIFFLLIAEQSWFKRRSEAVLIPEFKYTYPMISYMASNTKELQNAKLATFVEQYIKKVYDERAVNYHKPTNQARSAQNYLKTSLMEAAEMSRVRAKKENLEKFSNSNETYKRLIQCNCGWIFNISAIESVQTTPYHDTIIVSVLGDYQVTYDQAKSEMPHKFWGFKRLWLTIVQDIPSRDKKGNYINEYGLYVIDQFMEDLSYSEKDELLKSTYKKGYLVP